QHTRIRIDQSETASERGTALGEGIRPRCIENDDAGLELESGQRPAVIGNSQCFRGDVRVTGDLGIDRNEKILPLKLQPITGNIDEGYGTRPRARRLIDEVAKGAAHRILIEIARAYDVEARRLQRLCDQARIVCRRIERATRLIAGISDHQRNALFRLRRARYDRQSERDQRKQDGGERANSWHGCSIDRDGGRLRYYTG